MNPTPTEQMANVYAAFEETDAEPTTAAPSYHDRIINLPGKHVFEFELIGSGLAYNEGHCDARHAAAEIVSEADARITELETQLAEAHNAIADWQEKYHNAQVEATRRAISYNGLEDRITELKAQLSDYNEEIVRLRLDLLRQPGFLPEVHER
jgi:chromosome segregation ATPase